MKKKWMMLLGLGAMLVSGSAWAWQEPQRVSCSSRCQRRYDRQSAEARARLRQCMSVTPGNTQCFEDFQLDSQRIEAERADCLGACLAN